MQRKIKEDTEERATFSFLIFDFDFKCYRQTFTFRFSLLKPTVWQHVSMQLHNSGGQGVSALLFVASKLYRNISRST